jgi:hypothetical protein
VEGPALVAPFQDRNGDGRIDVADGGDVIVVSTWSRITLQGRVRVLDGRTGIDLWTFDEPPSGWDVDVHVTPAVGDVDGDGFPEIVVANSSVGDHYLIMYNWDGSVRWLSPVLVPWNTSERRGGLSLADLDGDGVSEILASSTVINADGSLRVVLDLPSCRESYPLDMDLDGVAEIVCGANVARQDGTVYFQVEPMGLGTSGPAQLDADPYPEILACAASNPPYLGIDDDGSILWQGGYGLTSYGSSEAVADVDGDGLSDMLGGDRDAGEEYVVARGGRGDELWRTPSLDASPGGGTLAHVMGPLTFLHEDAYAFRAMDAATGEDVFTLDNSHATYFEAEVFADLDGDGRGELVTTSTQETALSVRAWRDDSWCDARPLWTQHAFAPVYVGDDLRPAGPPTTPIDWLSVGFRKQVNGCTCVAPPDVDVVPSPGCDPDVACVSTDVTGGTEPFAHEWTLPDGSTSSEASPCFPVMDVVRVSVIMTDARGCVVEAWLDVEPPLPRSVGIAVTPDCALLCATAVPDGVPGPLTPAWTLPDGSTSTEDAPCFAAAAPGTLSLEAVDPDGCTWTAEIAVEPPVPPVPVELSTVASGWPLRVVRIPAGVHVSWEAVFGELDHALWAGTLGDWASHAAVACLSGAAEADDPSPAGNRYYLAGEIGCDGTSGSLGGGWYGARRATPPSGCP